MNRRNTMATLAALAAGVCVTLVMTQMQIASHAQSTTVFVPYDVKNGELSPGTQAPMRAQMMQAIQTASASSLQAVLEYGERVECLECIPLLNTVLLEDARPLAREMAAWWLRRRIFGGGEVLRNMALVLVTPSETIDHRERAATAIGEFMEPKMASTLIKAASDDTEPRVRAAAIQGLVRLNLNSTETRAAFIKAMTDTSPHVQLAGLRSWGAASQMQPPSATELLPLLASNDADVRKETLTVLGQRHHVEAISQVGERLVSDPDPAVRMQAAWALSVMGDRAAASLLLQSAIGKESSQRVRDAIELSLRNL